MVNVKVVDLSKSFRSQKQTVAALNHINFEVGDAELVTILGPSACGKTTTLRCIAGLEKADSGKIFVGNQTVFSSEENIDLSPNQRNIAMVFQSYAVWPHMNVFDNVAYGLKVRKVPNNEIKDRVEKTLSLVNMEGLNDRYATQLSGGQQQRVALARSLVLEPKVLLLDEPLSNLDAKLRDRTRFELQALLRRLGVTTLYVTHDQAEAIVFSDRIILMNAGRIEQIDSPFNIYTRPFNSFVANFIGSTNLLKGKVFQSTDGNGTLIVETDGGLKVHCTGPQSLRDNKGQVYVSIRPEDISMHKGTSQLSDSNVWKGKVSERVFTGSSILYLVKVMNDEVRIQANPSDDRFEVDGMVYVAVPKEKCLAFDK
ncbi:ABC transporter ATP-binding protein [Candidatus Bathyarchaeota archaeon]|nr:ABC transporter ATP-binding protein [Candidatus Bathyarchaeota archaeon]